LQLLDREGSVVAGEQVVHLLGFTPQLTATQRAAVDRLLRDFAATPFSPPTRAEWETAGAELIGYLIESGRLVRVSPDVLFSGEGYAKLVEWTQHLLDEGGEVTVAMLRDRFATSRKYALAFLEHLDERKITRRVGDVRVKY
jgi:selenocysteine-specific elongation factor